VCVHELGCSRRADELMSRSQLLARTRNKQSHTQPRGHAHQQENVSHTHTHTHKHTHTGELITVGEENNNRWYYRRGVFAFPEFHRDFEVSPLCFSTFPFGIPCPARLVCLVSADEMCLLTTPTTYISFLTHCSLSSPPSLLLGMPEVDKILSRRCRGLLAKVILRRKTAPRFIL